MKTGEQGLRLIKHFEGLHDGDKIKARLQPIMCPAGIWTVGYGHTLINKNSGKYLKGVKEKNLALSQYPEFADMTVLQAEELLRRDLVRFENAVSKEVARALKQHEFDAIVAHTYNTGGSSTLISMIRKNAPMEEIYKWWVTHYTTSAGIHSNGLLRRRRAEAALFTQNKIILE